MYKKYNKACASHNNGIQPALWLPNLYVVRFRKAKVLLSSRLLDLSLNHIDNWSARKQMTFG